MHQYGLVLTCSLSTSQAVGSCHDTVIPTNLAVQSDCVNGQLVCEFVYGDIMHYQNILGSFAREQYCIPVTNFSYMTFDDKKHP